MPFLRIIAKDFFKIIIFMKNALFKIMKEKDMKKQNNDFKKTSKEILEKSKKEIIKYFNELVKETKSIEPISLLSQMALSTIGKTGSEKILAERKLEFLSGFLLVHSRIGNLNEIIDHKLMDQADKVFNILDNYFHAISSYLFFENEMKRVMGSRTLIYFEII